MPLWESPMRGQQQRIQRLGVAGDGGAGRAGGVEDRQDVLCRSAVGVAEALERLPVGAYGLAARVQRQQHLIGVGGGLADALALAAHTLGER